MASGEPLSPKLFHSSAVQFPVGGVPFASQTNKVCEISKVPFNLIKPPALKMLHQQFDPGEVAWRIDCLGIVPRGHHAHLHAMLKNPHHVYRLGYL